MAKSRSRNLADVIGKKSIYAQNYTDVAANNGVTLSQLALDVDGVEELIGSGTLSLVSNTYLQAFIANTNAAIADGDVTSVSFNSANNILTVTTGDGTTHDAQIDVSDKATWTALTSTNTALRALITANASDISDNATDISTQTARIDLLNTNLTSTNTAVRSYVDQEVAALVDSAPATLDTLNELAAALGDDANFVTTLTTNLGQKLGATATVNLSGDVTGSASFSGNSMTLTTDISNSGVTAGSYGSSTAVPVLTIGADGRVTGATTQTVAGVTGVEFTTANNNLRVSVADGTTYDAVITVSDKATWTELLATNTAIRSLISDVQTDVDNKIANANSAISNVDGRVDLVNTNLTSTNTALRSLITTNANDINANLANTNAWIATLDTDLNAEIFATWQGLTSTNTAIRGLISDLETDVANKIANANSAISDVDGRVDLVNTNLTATNTAIRSLISGITSDIDNKIANANTDIAANESKILQVEANLLATNTAVRGYVDQEVAALVDSAPAALDTLNELAAALGDDENFATTLSTNLGQKLGATATVTLTGDVTGSANFSANAVSVVTDIADSGVTAGSYGSGGAVPVITVGADGRITSLTTTTVGGITSTSYTQGNNVYRVSTSDGKTYDTVIPTSDKLQVANAAATYETISNVNANLANTNAWIASVESTERAALANTNAYIADVKTIATNRLGETATITLTGDVGGTASFSSNAATITVLSNNLAANSFVTANYVSNTAFQAYIANNSYVFSEYTFTAANGQQSFGGADDNGNTLSYISGKTSVFMNGVMLVNGNDYFASNTSSIWLADAAGADDVITMQAFDSASNFVEKDANISTGSATLSGTSAQVVDTFGTGDYRTVKYIVQCTDTDNNYYQSAEVLLIHDGTTVEITQYGSVELGNGDIMSIDADISGGNVRLKVTPTGTNSVVKVLRLMVV